MSFRTRTGRAAAGPADDGQKHECDRGRLSAAGSSTAVQARGARRPAVALARPGLAAGQPFWRSHRGPSANPDATSRRGTHTSLAFRWFRDLSKTRRRDRGDSAPARSPLESSVHTFRWGWSVRSGYATSGSVARLRTGRRRRHRPRGGRALVASWPGLALVPCRSCTGHDPSRLLDTVARPGTRVADRRTERTKQRRIIRDGLGRRAPSHPCHSCRQRSTRSPCGRHRRVHRNPSGRHPGGCVDSCADRQRHRRGLWSSGYRPAPLDQARGGPAP